MRPLARNPSKQILNYHSVHTLTKDVRRVGSKGVLRMRSELNREYEKLRFRPLKSDDLEFSEYGRDPRFGPAWWIMPALLIAVISISAISV